MDAEAFLDLANQVAKLKMYPYFDLAYAVVCCLAIKEDMGSGVKVTKTLFILDRCGDKKARVFVPEKHFQPSLIRSEPTQVGHLGGCQHETCFTVSRYFVMQSVVTSSVVMLTVVAF